MEVRGLDGRDLNEVWADGPEAYLGIDRHRLPEHVRPLRAEHEPRRRLGRPTRSSASSATCSTRSAALRDGGFRYLDAASRGAGRVARARSRSAARERLWSRAGCSNWYVNDDGVNTNNWPGPWLEFRRRTHRINPGDYRVAV